MQQKKKELPQLTFRAVVMGGVIGLFMAISNLYTTVKIGWAFGVAITACVISFVTWNAICALSRGRIHKMTILESNCMQSTASSAGYSTGSTLGTAFGAMLLISGQHMSVPVVFLNVLLTALLGVFIAIPMKRRMINVEKLPFPSGIAAAETLKSLYGEGVLARKKAYALVAALAAGAMVAFFRVQKGMLTSLDRFHELLGNWLRLPEIIAFPSTTLMPRANSMIGFGFEPSVLLIGAGLIVGLRVSLSMLASSLVLHLIICPWLLDYDASLMTLNGVPSFIVDAEGKFLPMRWSLWGGAAIIVVASLTTVFVAFRSWINAFRLMEKIPKKISSREYSEEVPMTWFFAGVIPIAIAIILVNLWAFNMSILLSVVAIILSFVLALITCRAVGETDTAPIGAMGKVTQVLFALLAKGNVTINVMSASITACAASSSADLLTDLKSGYLLNANPKKQFLAQFFGVFFGVLSVVPAWYLMFPTKEILDSFNPPATNMWKAVALALTEGLHTIPETAQLAALIGAALGLLLPLTSALFPKSRPYLPSSMGIGLAWIMPFQNCLSFAIGAVIAFFWQRYAPKNADNFQIPIASGLIAGESIMASFIAILAALPDAISSMF